MKERMRRPQSVSWNLAPAWPERPVSVVPVHPAPRAPSALPPYLTVQLLHRHEVQRLQGVARGRDEVQAGVDSGVVVGVQHPADLQLLLQVGLELGVDEFHDGLVAGKGGESRDMARPLPNLGFRYSPFSKLKIPWVIWLSPCSWFPPAPFEGPAELQPLGTARLWNARLSLLAPVLPSQTSGPWNVPLLFHTVFPTSAKNPFCDPGVCKK